MFDKIAREVIPELKEKYNKKLSHFFIPTLILERKQDKYIN